MDSLLEVLAGLTGTVGAAAPATAATAVAAGDAGGRSPRAPGPVPLGGQPLGGQPLGGQPLRYALSLELLAADELTVAELIRRLTDAGFSIVGRASKTVSDALRWEIGHGRVVRVSRGRYRTGRIPRSTVRWMKGRLDHLRASWRGVSPAPVSDAASPEAARNRPAGAPPSGLTRYRRQQQARRAWEAMVGPRPTWRRASLLLA